MELRTSKWTQEGDKYCWHSLDKQQNKRKLHVMKIKERKLWRQGDFFLPHKCTDVRLEILNNYCGWCSSSYLSLGQTSNMLVIKKKISIINLCQRETERGGGGGRGTERKREEEKGGMRGEERERKRERERDRDRDRERCNLLVA